MHITLFHSSVSVVVDGPSAVSADFARARAAGAGAGDGGREEGVLRRAAVAEEARPPSDPLTSDPFGVVSAYPGPDPRPRRRRRRRAHVAAKCRPGGGGGMCGGGREVAAVGGGAGEARGRELTSALFSLPFATRPCDGRLGPALAWPGPRKGAERPRGLDGGGGARGDGLKAFKWFLSGVLKRTGRLGSTAA